MRYHHGRMLPGLLASLILIGGRGAAQEEKVRLPAEGEPAPAVAKKQEKDAPDIRIEYFGAERGYTVGSAQIPILCVVRNIGKAPLTEKTLRLRCAALSGLDYTLGELTPTLPELTPGQAVAFRWKLAPSDSSSPLIAALLVERLTPEAPMAASPPKGGTQVGVTLPGNQTPSPTVSVPPRAYVTVVPRLTATLRPASGMAGADAAPKAGANGDEAWVGNDRVFARLQTAPGRLPLLKLAGRDGLQWRELATAVPMAQIRSGEEGQVPWWETFRWRETRVSADKDSATLTLIGNAGSRWRVELILESRRDTGALYGTLRLVARRPMRLYGVQFPRLLAEPDMRNAPSQRADGTALPVASDPSPLPDTATVAAARLEATTFGLSWAATPPLANWRWNRLPTGDASLAPVYGAQWESSERGEVVLPGAVLVFPFRLFALAPSDTIRDAQRFALP